MTIKLDIKVGSSIDDSVSVDYVDGTPTSIKNDNVDGEMLVLLKDKENEHNTYFSNENNKSITWSIQFRGFLNDENENADDIVFGNQWSYPIRDRLPWGTSVAVKFINFLDPSMQHDLQSDQPWAFSPLVSTVERLNIQNEKPSSSDIVIKDDVRCVVENEQLYNNSKARRNHFQNSTNRNVNLSRKFISFDFAKGFIDFKTLSLSFPDINFHLGLLKYWDGQPVRFFLKNRKSGKIYAIVHFIITDVGKDADEEVKKVAENINIGYEN